MLLPGNYKPPRWPFWILQLFCAKGQLEDVEGDLIERFNSRLETAGYSKAKWLLIKDIMHLIFSGWLIDQIQMKALNMKKTNWVKLIGVNLVLILLILAPYLPGPPIKLSVGLSMFAQAAGLVGLLLVPFALVWLYFEIKKPKLIDAGNFNWKIPYWLSIVSFTIVSLLLSMLALVVSLQEGWVSGAFDFLIIIILAGLTFREIQKLRNHNDKKFNTTPVYLLTIPIIAFLTSLYFVKPASEYSRSLAIQRAQELITSIENYKVKEGKYPESIEALKGSYLQKIPSSKVIGVPNFRYNKIDEDYSLSFSQWLDWGSLEVLVLYDKNNLRNKLKGRYAEWDYSFDLCRVKGAFASYDTKFENWRYYLLD